VRLENSHCLRRIFIFAAVLAFCGLELAFREKYCTASQGTEIVDAVIKQWYHNKKYNITPKNQFNISLLNLNDAGFEDTRVLQNLDPWPQEFEKITPVTTYEGPFLSLAAHAGKLRIGDIILVYPVKSMGSDGVKRNPLIMFYAGEQSFPDLGTKTLDTVAGQDVDAGDQKLARLSFFLYPYVAGFEWNTYPPRQHRALRSFLFDKLSFWDKLVAWTKRVFTKFSFVWNPDSSFKFVKDHRRNVEWLGTKIAENHCGVFHKDTQWSVRVGKNKVRIRYQIVRIPDNCKYITLKRRFPLYEQSDSQNTCFFATYSQVAFYQMYKSDKSLDAAAIRKYEDRLIDALVISPQTARDRRASDFFRGELIREKAWEDDETEGESKKQPPVVWSSRWNDSRMNQELKEHKHLAKWVPCCFWEEGEHLGLNAVVKTDKNNQQVDASILLSQDEVFELLKTMVESDTPLITYFFFNGDDAGTGVEWPDHVWRGMNEIRLKDDKPDSLVAHVVPVIGVRQCGAQKYVHIAWNDRSYYYITLENFYNVVSKQQKDKGKMGDGIRIPSDWKIGQPIPDQEKAAIPRFMIIERGKEMFHK
jgi:hypothetical protein